MTVCEFLHCTFTEMKSRVQNPADYALILAYIAEKNDRQTEAQAKAKDKAEFDARTNQKPKFG